MAILYLCSDIPPGKNANKTIFIFKSGKHFPWLPGEMSLLLKELKEVYFAILSSNIHYFKEILGGMLEHFNKKYFKSCIFVFLETPCWGQRVSLTFFPLFNPTFNICVFYLEEVNLLAFWGLRYDYSASVMLY